MRYYFLILLMILIGCGKESANKCAGITCDSWERCTSDSGVCVAQENRCNTETDCATGYNCSSDHYCINSENPCEGQACSGHGNCGVVGDRAICACEEGYVADGLSCRLKPCIDGERKRITCGSDGELQDQLCVAGVWQYDGICQCVNQSQRTTTCIGNGIQYQSCVDGSWQNSGECITTTCSTAGETREIPCGFNSNGVQSQICIGTTWSNSGSCIDGDICKNGSKQIVPDSKCDGSSLNGRGSAEEICVAGQWSSYENSCKEIDICKDGVTESIAGNCGLNNRGTLYKKCVTGQWDFKESYCNEVDSCIDDQTRNVANSCGLNSRGTQPQKCVTGKWENSGECIESDSCTDGETQTLENICGLNQRGDQLQRCVAGQWQNSGGCVDPDVCVDEDEQIAGNSCGRNSRGGQPQKCVNGQWQNYGSCIDPDICIDGMKQFIDNSCGLNNRGEQPQICVIGQWQDNDQESCIDPDICRDHNTRMVLCDTDSTLHREEECVLGDWVAHQECFILTRQWESDESPRGRSVITDHSGDLFITGAIWKDNEEEYDIYVSKHDNMGNMLWRKQFGTEKSDEGNSIAVDQAGNIFVMGNTRGDLTGDGLNSGGYPNLFLAKLDHTGEMIWAKQWEVASVYDTDTGTSMAVDSLGNILITGYTENDLGGNENQGDEDGFLIKIDSNGNTLWTRQWGTDGRDRGHSVAIDQYNNIIVGGEISERLVSGADGEIFLIKFNSSGVEQWRAQWGAQWNVDYGDSANAVAVDPSGDIFITGETRGDFEDSTNPGDWDLFLSKVSKNGDILWTKQWGAADGYSGKYDDIFVSSIAINPSGDVFVTGNTDGDLDGHSNQGSYDLFVMRFSNDGNKIWTKQWGTEDPDSVDAITSDLSGNIFLTGSMSKGVNGNTPETYFGLFLTRIGAE